MARRAEQHGAWGRCWFLQRKLEKEYVVCGVRRCKPSIKLRMFKLKLLLLLLASMREGMREGGRDLLI